MIGIVYGLFCNKTGKKYIGSSYLYQQRKQDHIKQFFMWQDGNANFVSSFEIIQNNCYYFEILEEVEYENEDDLKWRERYWVENIIDGCVNRIRPIITTDEKKKYKKEYYEEHRDNEILRMKEWYKENKQHVLEYQKEYYDENKEKVLAYHKEYYNQNKKKIREKQNEKIICVCGVECAKQNKARHERSPRHLAYIQS